MSSPTNSHRKPPDERLFPMIACRIELSLRPTPLAADDCDGKTRTTVPDAKSIWRTGRSVVLVLVD